MVFYFTGTGNSLYAARQIEGEPVSIPQLMGQGRLDFTAERIGIVTPIYGHEMPEVNPDARCRSEYITLQELMNANHQG